MYYWNEKMNFGDELNSWFWRELFSIKRFSGNKLYTGIGSILSDDMPDARKVVVLGSGAGLAPLPRRFLEEPLAFEIYWVRGTVSCDIMSIGREHACCDPAILLGQAKIEKVERPCRKGRVGFVPHLSTSRSDGYQKVAEKLGLVYIDPRRPSRCVIQDLITCERVVTEAMHGAIFCESLRIPWLPVSISPELGSLKWFDWCRSVGHEYAPVRLPVLDSVQRVKLSRRNQLDAEGAFKGVLAPGEVERAVAELRDRSHAKRAAKRSTLIGRAGKGLIRQALKFASFTGDASRRALAHLEDALGKEFLLARDDVVRERCDEIRDRMERFMDKEKEFIVRV